MGVFTATDVFLFYVLFEAMLVPMYFLIGRFGGPRRQYAAVKFFLYSLFGGLIMLASVIGLFIVSGEQLGAGTFTWVDLQRMAANVPESTQIWLFLGFFVAFAIKAPLVPFHTWLPDAGAEAPIGAGVLLVGVLDKVGTFGFLRYCLPLFPLASQRLAPLVLTLAVIGILYGALLAVAQADMKRFVAYTSVAHFGFIALAIFAFSSQAFAGRVALHGQPRALHRDALRDGGHAGHPRRVAADPRLRRRVEDRTAPGGSVPARGALVAGPAGHQLVRLRVPGAGGLATRANRSSPSSRRAASSSPPSTSCGSTSRRCRARCAAPPYSARSSAAAGPARWSIRPSPRGSPAPGSPTCPGARSRCSPRSSLLILVLGFFPGPVLDVINPSVVSTMNEVGLPDPVGGLVK